MKRIYVVEAEHYPGENQARAHVEDQFHVIGVFEDQQDALDFLKSEKDSGDWGDFYVKQPDGDGWSDAGWFLAMSPKEFTPKSSRAKAKSSKGAKKFLDAINLHRAKIGQAPLDPEAAGWSAQEVEVEARRIARLNPRQKRIHTRGDAALGAGLGSAAGAAVGMALFGPAGAGAGSIGGGLGGGDYFAPKGSRNRTRVGGGIGGIFGPLGAALGAYIGSGKKDKRPERNPSGASILDSLEPAERRELKKLLSERADVRFQAVRAENLGQLRDAAKWRRREQALDMKLYQLEERLHLFDTRRNGRRPTRTNGSLKRKLMGGGR